MRRLIAFPCAGETLLGTLDTGDRTTGLLIVSGGNEVRAGAHRGMAMLAARIAAGGTPVFRYDRRGIGDSSGTNTGFGGSADDLAAAVRAFRAAAPQIGRVLGFGNCDGATTLALYGRAAGIDAAVLANPWISDEPDALPPPAAIRAHYASRLRDPRSWARLVRGDVNLASVARGLRKVARGNPVPVDRAAALAAGIAGYDISVIALATGDATAITFREAWGSVPFASAQARTQLIEIDTASHSFASETAATALEAAIRTALERTTQSG